MRDRTSTTSGSHAPRGNPLAPTLRVETCNAERWKQCVPTQSVGTRVVWLIALLSAIGCQQKMADQPSYKQLAPCEFFADGRSARPSVPGTVARGQLHADIALTTGRHTGKDGEPMGMAAPAALQPKPDSPEAAKAKMAQYDMYVDTFPYPMTEKILEHGHERYSIYCVVCHDPLGTGKGKIVQRGYTGPPTYHTDRLRNVPAGYLFAVISEGYGSMPSYAEQIPLHDRWAIAGYLRALQASQHFPKSGQWSVVSDQDSETPNPNPQSLIPDLSIASPHPNPNTVQIIASRIIVTCCQDKDCLGAFTPLSGEAGIRPGVYAGLGKPFDFTRSSTILWCQPRLRGSCLRWSPVNRAEKSGESPLATPGVNARPNTACGGKPDESGCI
jgi:mono/diheme cytochrome c family protein